MKKVFTIKINKYLLNKKSKINKNVKEVITKENEENVKIYFVKLVK